MPFPDSWGVQGGLVLGVSSHADTSLFERAIYKVPQAFLGGAVHGGLV